MPPKLLKEEKMKYLVDIKETSYATVEIDAESKDAAEDIAFSLYSEGKIDWLDSDLDFDARKREKDRGER